MNSPRQEEKIDKRKEGKQEGTQSTCKKYIWHNSTKINNVRKPCRIYNRKFPLMIETTYN